MLELPRVSRLPLLRRKGHARAAARGGGAWTRPTSSVSLERADIKRIRKYLPRFVGSFIGIGVGLGIGAGLGAIGDRGCHGCDNPGVGRVVGIALGVPIGGILGSHLKGR